MRIPARTASRKNKPVILHAICIAAPTNNNYIFSKNNVPKKIYIFRINCAANISKKRAFQTNMLICIYSKIPHVFCSLMITQSTCRGTGSRIYNLSRGIIKVGGLRDCTNYSYYKHKRYIGGILYYLYVGRGNFKSNMPTAQ